MHNKIVTAFLDAVLSSPNPLDSQRNAKSNKSDELFNYEPVDNSQDFNFFDTNFIMEQTTDIDNFNKFFWDDQLFAGQNQSKELDKNIQLEPQLKFEDIHTWNDNLFNDSNESYTSEEIFDFFDIDLPFDDLPNIFNNE